MIKGCNYYSIEWVDRFSGLAYRDLTTEIVGNTFYINRQYTEEVGFFIKRKKIVSRPIVILPMCKMLEYTIVDVLVAWNFGVKYEWLNEIHENIK